MMPRKKMLSGLDVGAKQQDQQTFSSEVACKLICPPNEAIFQAYKVLLE